jgi:NAD(P)H-hydrate epimerase
MTELPDWLDPLPAADAMRAADAAQIAAGTPGIELMERAGAGLARVAAQAIPSGTIAILCGKGNNGGDGFVAARELREAGRDVAVAATATADEYSGDAAIALERMGERVQPYGPGVLEGAAGAIDALLGTGTSGAPHGTIGDAVRALRDCGLPVVACDVPSGVDASTGEVEDPAVAVRAVATATFGAAKPGLWIAPGKSYAGEVEVVDIGLPARIASGIGLLARGDVLRLVAGRDSGSTKFSAGHVVVVGGSRGLTGAVCLAADAAARAGAGYVTACVPASLETIFEVKLTEVMTVALADRDGRLAESAVDDAVAQSERHAGAVVLGSGLGRGSEQTAFVRGVTARIGAPLVLDADGLNALAGEASQLATRSGATVITPHAGELARLMGTESAEIEARRLHWAREAATATAAVVVLKGDDTLIVSPDGRVAVSEGGAPGLATAGTGDVLAGVCGAMLAAGLDPFTAACAAARLHVVAGRLAAEPHGPDGVIASDVVAALPAARSVA